MTSIKSFETQNSVIIEIKVMLQKIIAIMICSQVFAYSVYLYAIASAREFSEKVFRRLILGFSFLHITSCNGGISPHSVHFQIPKGIFFGEKTAVEIEIRDRTVSLLDIQWQFSQTLFVGKVWGSFIVYVLYLKTNFLETISFDLVRD